ncbi:hypothetical protein FRC08_000846 [Ceratobasidium sp. 394]|nr:hypothetical protein FRC08_000846 [Ceratobasidium sp. 394]
MSTTQTPGYLLPLAAGLSLAIIARSAYVWLLPKPLPNIPHNPVTGFLGDLPELGRYMKGGDKRLGDYLETQVLKHGPICQVMAGRAALVIIADRVEYERLLLKTKSTEQSRWTGDVFGVVIPTGQIALPTNEVWKRHRQLTGPSMSRRYLERMSTRVSAGAYNLVRLWTRKAELVGDKAFDADKDLKLAIVDTILSITMGDTPSFIDVVYASLPTSSSSLALDANCARFPQSDLPPLHKSLREMMESIERIQFNIFSQELGDRVVGFAPCGGHPGDGLATDADCVVDMITQREAREGAEKFEKGELLDELMTYVLAGQDTTSAALSWLLKYLPLDTDIQRRLHDELCTAFGLVSDGDEPLDFNVLNDSSRVPVLEAVVAETLRCAKIAPAIGRELIADEVVLGRHIPKGTQITLVLGYMSMQESDWGPDAKTWRPARWLRDDGSFNSAAGPSFAFGIGHRACFGQRLALLQLKTYVATLSRAFMFKPLPPEVDDWGSVLKVTREPKSFHVSLGKWPAD